MDGRWRRYYRLVMSVAEAVVRLRDGREALNDLLQLLRLTPRPKRGQEATPGGL